MTVLTKTGAEVFAGYTAAGVARALDPADMATWATEIEIVSGVNTVSATQRLGKFWIIPTDTTAIINVPEDAATLQAAIDGTMTWFRAVGASIRIVVTGHQDAVSTIATFHRTDGMPIAVVGGTTPLSLVFSSFATPTGAKGNRTLDMTVSDGSGVAVGDIITLRDFVQSYPDSGSKALPSGPTSGSFQYGYNINGDANTLLSVSGTTATFSQAVSTDVAPVDSLLIVQGQCRRITARPTTTTATLSSAVKIDQSSFVYWAIMKCEAGTVSGTPSGGGTALTGTSTAFSTVGNAGDCIFIEDVDCALVLDAIASATSATAEKQRTFTGKRYAILNRWWELETCFLVTAKASANVISMRHESWAAENLPFRNLAPGEIKCFKDSLNGTANGCVFKGGGVQFDNIAIIGNSSGAGLDGSQSQTAGKITLTETVSVIGFQYGAHFESSMTLVAVGASFHGAALACLYFTHSAVLKGDSIRAHSGGSYSLLVDLGGNAYLSRMRFCCSREDAIRGEVLGGVYSDFGVACSNGGRAFQLIGKFHYHLVGAMVGFNGGEYTGGGLDIQNTGGGRSTGMFAFCNYGPAINSASGQGEASYLTAMGNTVGGVSATGGGRLTCDRSGIVDSDYWAVDSADGGVSLPYSVIAGNDGGVRGLKLDSIDLQGSYIDDNTALSGRNDLSIYAAGKAYVQGISGSPTMNLTLNVPGAGGAMIFNDSAPNYTSLVTFPTEVQADYRIGNQSSFITGSATAGLLYSDTPVSNLLDGTISSGTDYFNAVSVSGKYIRTQFDAPTVVQEITFYQSATSSHGTWKLQGSHDGATWVDIGSSFTLGGSVTQVITAPSANKIRYRYYQLIGVSGTASSSPYLYGIQFKCL